MTGSGAAASSDRGGRGGGGYLQLCAPRLRRHGLDQVPAVPGWAHACHWLHQHALGKVSLGPARWVGGSARPATARAAADDARTSTPPSSFSALLF